MMYRLTLLLVGLCCAFASFAQPTVNLQPASVTAAVGDQLTIAFVVQDFTTVASYQHSINWNEDALSLVGLGQVNPNMPGLAGSFNLAEAPDGISRVSWFDPSLDLAGITLPDGDTLFTMVYEVISTTGTDVAITGTPAAIEVSQDSGNTNAGLNTTPAAVNGGGPPNNNNPGNSTAVTFNLGDQTGNVGDQICVPLTVQNFTNIGGVGFTITFDPVLLQFDGAQNIQLAGATTNNFNAPASQPGNIIFTWNNNTAQTLANGSVLYDLCFTALGAGSDTVTITDNLTPVEVIDGNNQPVTDIVLDPATVTLSGGGTTSTDLTLTVGTGSGDTGNQVCVPITADNFDNISGLGFTVSFDHTLVQFDSVANIGLAGMSQNNVNAPASQPGKLIFTWDNSDAQTLPDGTVLFELCFGLIGSGGTQSAVAITSDLTPLEAIATVGGSTQSVPVGVVDGEINIANGTAGSTDLTFSLPNFTIAPGSNGCVPVTAANFTNLVSAQFTIEFDETLFAFTGAADFNLPDLTANNFNAPASLPGKLIFSWNTADPVDRANGETLFTLCFDALGNLGDQAPITISGNPSNIEVFDDAGNLVDPVIIQPGTLIIDNVMTGPDPLELTLANVSTDAGTNICLPLTVTNFTEITATTFSIEYDAGALTFTGAQSFSITGLGASDVSSPNAGTIMVDFSNATPQSVADGTTMLELCFDATGSPGTTVPVTFGSGASATNAAGTLDVNTTNGQVGINSDDPLPTGDVIFVLPDQTAASGEQVCFPLTVYDFNNILTFNYSFCYDTLALDFVGPQNINLTDLSANNIPEPSNGNITILFFSDSNLNDGATVPDGTVIVELCFDVLAPNGTTTVVEFCDTPTPTEVADNNENILIPGFGDGTVNIQQTSNCAAISVSATTTDVDCNGGSTGAITATAAGGDGNFNYAWSTGATTATIDNLAAGTYDLTVTSCGGAATSTESFTISQPASLSISSAQVTNIDCNGAANGAIDIEVTGGSPGYTYNWSNNAPNDASQDQQNLSAGSYSVVITDTKGCVVTSPTYTITEPAAIAVSPTTTANPSGCGTADGSLTINVSGGTAPLQYSLNGGAFQSAATFNNLTAGTYSLRVRDANGCEQGIGSATLTGNDTPPTIIVNSLTPADPNTANGAIDLLITNGSGNYSFAWTPGGFTTEDISGLNGGEYTVTVTDNVSNCTNSLTILVPTTIQVSGTVGNTCEDDNDGSITLTVIGGNSNGSFQYSYSPAGVGTQDANGNLTDLPAGTYTVTVSDGSGLVPDGTATFTVEALPAPTIGNAVITNVSGLPNNSNGCIELTISGGMAPLTIQWSNGVQTVDNCDIPTGTYTVTVTDANGCVTTGGPYEVGFDQEDLTIGPATTEVLACTDSTLVCFAVGGGVAPYSITTVASDNSSTNETLPAAGDYCITLLAGDTYTFVVNDASNQSMSFTVTVAANPGSTTFTTAITPATAAGGNGAIDLTLTSDDGPFTYAWSNGATTEDIQDLDPGCYEVTITNAVGCTVVSGDLCVEVLTIGSAVVTDNPCPNNLIGAVDVTIQGATNATYAWTNVTTGAVVSTNEDLTGQPAGTYALVITDGSGQTAGPFTYVIDVESDIDVAIAVDSDFNGSAISCVGADDGALRVVATGGVAPYVFLWSTGAETEMIDGLVAGEYFVTVQDANECSMTTSLVIADPAAIQLTSSTTATSCADDVDGSATVMATGGTGAFTYQWDADAGEQTGATATELSAGSYSVTATDANACSAETTVTVDEPSAIDVLVTAAPDTGDKNGMATTVASGGTAPYAYSYSHDTGASGAIVEGLVAGDYAVTVTDANGCTATQDFRIDEIGNCLATRPVVTPNGDGLNENFVIGCVQQYETATLQIFNRWGQEVFSMPNYDNSWTGQTNRGNLLPEGVYFFVLDYRPVGGTNEQLRGNVTLLRE